jgi:arginyl-tRNA synthetase
LGLRENKEIMNINKGMTLIEKIEDFISARDNSVTKVDVVKILDYIIEDVPEDKVYLESFRDNADSYWSSTNSKMVKNFKKILSSYGIITEETNVDRRSIMEKKGKNIVKKFIELKHKQEINEILRIN